MAHHTLTDRPSSALLTATRWLAGLHAAGGVGLLALAGYSFLEYRDAPADETFAGLWIIFGAGYALLGVVLVVLGVGTVKARSATGAWGCGLATGLVALALGGPGSFLLLTAAPWTIGAAAASIALVACSVVGLAGRVEPSPVSL